MRSSAGEGHFSRGERKDAAPSSENGDVLLTVDGVSDGSSDDAGLGVGGPESLAIVSAVGFEISLGGTFENKIPSSGEEATVDSGRPIDALDFFLLDGIPGGEMALDGTEDGLLDFRLLRQTRGD